MTAAAEALRPYRRAADYIAAVQMFLRENVLLREPLRADHLKPTPLGHWGTCPGINLIYAGLNRLVDATGADVMLVTGPGHGAPAVHANLWLEGVHADYDPALTRDESGLAELARRYSSPGGFASNLEPAVPGSIYQGGEVGYALPTAFGAALDAPDRIVACIVGDGEAETGPTAAAWQSTKFLDPVTSGAVLPVLHLNGYKIESPSLFATLDDDEITSYFRGSGWEAVILDATVTSDPDAALAAALDDAHTTIRQIQSQARTGQRPERPRWPMIVLKSPKGWGTVDDVDGTPMEGTFHSHHLPLSDAASDPAHLEQLERWLRSYRPAELFDDDGRPTDEVLHIVPSKDRRTGDHAVVNGGQIRSLPLPPLEPHVPDSVAEPGHTTMSPVETLGSWLADVMRATEHERDFRIMCPDEIESNKLGSVLDASPRAYSWPVEEYAEHLAPDGRVMEVLSEHLCHGWLQGYLLTGRHGLFPTYEAFAMVAASMLTQHAKFLKQAREVTWRQPVSSFTYLLTSLGWHQQANGYTHQAPSLVDHALTQPPSVTRVLLPPDAPSLLAVMQECLTSTDRINVVVGGKLPAPVWLDLDAAHRHVDAGISVWPWAGRNDDAPDVVLASAGGVPTSETLAAAWLLRRDAPELAVRVVNVVDLIRLAPPSHRPDGLSDDEFERLFPGDRPVVFAFHGHPSAIHRLIAGRPDAHRFHVRGFEEEGATTTPHDLLLANGVSRHHLAAEALRRAPGWAERGQPIADQYEAEIDDLRDTIRRDGVDPASITEWRWT